MPLLEFSKPSVTNIFGDRSKQSQPYYVVQHHPLYSTYNPKKTYLDGTIFYTFYIQFSEKLEPFKGHFRFKGLSTEVNNRIKLDAEQGKYSHLVTEHEIDWKNVTQEFVPFGSPAPLNYKKNRMKESTPFNIHTNLFGDVIELKTSEDNCVPETLKNYFPKLVTRKNDPFKDLKNANTEEVMQFCYKYGIRAIAYNIDKKVIAENIPEKDTGAYKTLVYISYMNHMYPIKNKFLREKPTNPNYERLSLEDLQFHFKQLLNDKIIPKNITLNQTNISSFIHKNVLYFVNDDFDDCKSIASKFMFSDKIPPQVSLTSILKYIEPLYTSTFSNSFLPIKHTKPAFYYNIRNRDTSRRLIQIDKNKAYANALKNLQYLLSTDIRTHQCIKTNKFHIEEALYIVNPTKPNILMPKQDIYAGEHVAYCTGKFDFTIQEMLVCKKQDNYFVSLIEDLFNVIDPDIAKKIIVRAIGTFQSEPTTESYPEIKVVNESERNPNHEVIYIEDLMLEKVPQIKPKNIYNRKPIAIQIKDKMNRILYEKMEELELTDDDIVQINTDSITFYEKPLEIKLDKSFNGWKSSEYKEKQGSIYETTYSPITFFQTIENQNTIIIGPAGNGKSYYIQHMDLTDSIILSSKHSAIKQHREKQLNAQVIQKYAGFSEMERLIIPGENHIIIEECGILTRQHWDFLYKCVLLNKKLTILGDFDQLLPYDEPNTFNQPAFINMIFKTQKTMNTNWRNDFTLDYYQQLKTADKEFLAQEIIKYSTRTPEEADIIIAYRNSTVTKYNDYMLNYHKKKFGDSNIPMMCITNDLREKNMYNNFIFTSEEIPKEILTENNFRVAYARTLYNMQGDECKSYYMAKEDLKWFTNPRMAYTLISRLKTR